MSAVLSQKPRGNHFRGVTKMVPQVITRRKPAAGFYQRSSSQGILDYSNRRRSRVTEDSSATARSVVQGLFIPRSQGNRQGILDSSNRATAEGNCRGILGSSNGGGNAVLGVRGIGIGIGRAFSPRNASRSRFLGRCPRLVWLWAFGPPNRQAPQNADVPVFHTALSTFAPCSRLPRQRRISIPAWGNAPGSPQATA